MKILGLDLGAQTGYAIAEDGRIVASGTKRFEGPRPQRFRLYAVWLLDVLRQQHPLDAVVYERPFARGLDATRSLWGMAGVTEAQGSLSSVVLDVNTSTLKRFAGAPGRRSDSKARVMAFVRDLGYNPESQDEADAVVVALYASKEIRTDGKQA